MYESSLIFGQIINFVIILMGVTVLFMIAKIWQSGARRDSLKRKPKNEWQNGENSITIPDDLLEGLTARAKAENTTVEALVETVLLDYLDLADETLAENLPESVRLRK